MKMVRRNYYVLLLLILLFAMPGIFALVFYKHPEWLGTMTTNKGTMLNPPVLLAHAKGHSKWELMLWSSTSCKKNCIAQLDKIARIRLALGRRLYDVELRLLMGADAEPLSLPLINGLHEQGIRIQTLSLEERKQMTTLPDQLEIFMVNPDGYLVLSYPPSVQPGDVFHDLKQLLNTAQKKSD